MRVRLVVFHLPEASSAADHRRFRRAVYGEATSSWGGRYEYRRKGFLDGVPHVRLYWGIVVVKDPDWEAFRRVLDEHGAVHAWRWVQATREDLRALRIKSA